MNPTDTNQASELFELCKEVYERTGWGFINEEFEDARNRLTSDNQIIYSSDYLLEKLPPALWIHASKEGRDLVNLLTVNMQGDGTVVVAYEIPYDEDFRGFYQSRSDTPLKALLKLTIALSEAGELDNDQSS